MSLPLPLRLFIPLMLVLFATLMGFYDLREDTQRANRLVERQTLHSLTERMTRMQSSFEYLLRDRRLPELQQEISDLGTDEYLQAAMLIDDQGGVIASIHLVDRNRSARAVLPALAATEQTRRERVAAAVLRSQHPQVYLTADHQTAIGIYPLVLGAAGGELRPNRVALLYMQQDLAAPMAMERRAALRDAGTYVLFWCGLALLLWIISHFLVTRRMAQLVLATQRLAAGDNRVRSGLSGRDELAVLGRAFDRMARQLGENRAQLEQSRQHLELALTAARMCTWQTVAGSSEVVWSEHVGNLLGVPAVQPQVRETLMRALDPVTHDCAGDEVERRIVLPDGTERWIACRGERFEATTDMPRHMTGVVWDVTERRRAADLLHEQKERAEVTLHSIGDAVITTDAEGCVDYLNPIAEQVTGWSTDEARGRPLREVFVILNELTREPAVNPVERCLREGHIVGLANHTVLIGRDGREVAIEDSAAPIRDRSGRIIGVVMVFHDVSQARAMARQLSWQATHDTLTGLLNRREFEQRLGMALGEARGGDHQHALLYLDLDQFKIVNDTCGHVAGDELLKQLATLLQARLREGDILARLGGDELGVLFSYCPEEQARHLAETLRQTVKEFRFNWEGKTFDVGVSIGVVGIDADSHSVADLLSAADMACYAAKDSGRNRIHVFHRGDTELVQRHGEMQWVNRITRAVEEDRLLLYRQRILPIAAVEPAEEHYEILVRLRGEDGDVIAPGAFIPAAERYGLMPAVDRWVIRTLFATMAGRTDNPGGPPCSYSINLSGVSLNDDSLQTYVREQLSRYAIAPQHIWFEITETAAIANLPKATRFIQEMKSFGCRFSLDDFGSGVSSFAYLKNLPVDNLKIDGSFVKDIVDDPIDYAMVQAINQIGHVMGLRTTAEFVENDAILERLRSIGVDYAQGYGIDRPQPFV